MSRRNEVYDAVALKLLANGYAPVPLSGKQPLIKGWQELFCDQPLTEDEVRSWGIGYRGDRDASEAAKTWDGDPEELRRYAHALACPRVFPR